MVDHVSFDNRVREATHRNYGSRSKALFDVFEEKLCERGLVRELTYVRQSTAYGCLAGSTESDGGQVLVALVEASTGADVGIDALQAAVAGLQQFLDNAIEGYCADRDPDIQALHSMFSGFRDTDLSATTTALLFTPGRVDAQARDKVSAGARCPVEIVDLEDLYERSNAVTTEVIQFADLSPEPTLLHPAGLDAGDHELWMGVVPGQTLARLFAIRGTRLLDANVRMFLGEKGVNKGIAETIAENPSRFAAYNNGVTMVVDDLVVKDGQVVSASNVSVVNGGQTTVSIFRAGRKGVDLAEVRVPLKVVHLTSEDDVRRKALLGNISRFANTQNSVKDTDRLVQDSPHPELQQASLELRDEANSGWFYERIRGEFATIEMADATRFEALERDFPAHQRMKVEDVAKAWMAWWGQPHVGAASATKAFSAYHGRLLVERHSGHWNTETHHLKTVGLMLMHKHLHPLIQANFSALRSASLPHTIGEMARVTDQTLNLVGFGRRGALDETCKKLLERLAHRVDPVIRAATEEENPLEFAKTEACTQAIQSHDITPDVRSLVDRLDRIEDGTNVPDPLAYLVQHGKTKVWDSFHFRKARLGADLNGSYFGKSMRKWPNLSPGGTEVVLAMWTKALSEGYLEQFPGPDDLHGRNG